MASCNNYFTPNQSPLNKIMTAITPDEMLDIMTAITPDEMLDSTAIGCGFHSWGCETGSIRVTADELRPVLQAAYDPSMPDWPSLIGWDDESGFFIA